MNTQLIGFIMRALKTIWDIIMHNHHDTISYYIGYCKPLGIDLYDAFTLKSNLNFIGN